MTAPLFTESQRALLIANRQATLLDEDSDPFPVVRLYTPDANAAWLLTELDVRAGIAYGLCDLGMGFPEVGYVSLRELETGRGPAGLPIVRDDHFVADRPLSAYARLARVAERIVT